MRGFYLSNEVQEKDLVIHAEPGILALPIENLGFNISTLLRMKILPVLFRQYILLVVLWIVDSAIGTSTRGVSDFEQ